MEKRNLTTHEIQLMQVLQQALDDDLLRINYIPMLDTVRPDIPCFEVQTNIKTSSGQPISHIALAKLAGEVKLDFKLDRWLVARAQKDLKKLHRSQPNAQLFVPQSLGALQAEDYPAWITRQQALNDVSNHGLVLSFSVSDMSKDIRTSMKLFYALHAIDIKICLRHFPEHPSALKLLKVMKASYVQIHPEILNTNNESITRILAGIKKAECQLILPEIKHATDVNSAWSEDTSFLSGDYIQAATSNIAFEFPATISEQ